MDTATTAYAPTNPAANTYGRDAVGATAIAAKDMPLMLRIGDSLRAASDTINRITTQTASTHDRVFGQPTWPAGTPTSGAEVSCAEQQIDALLFSLHGQLSTLESLNAQLTNRL